MKKLGLVMNKSRILAAAVLAGSITVGARAGAQEEPPPPPSPPPVAQPPGGFAPPGAQPLPPPGAQPLPPPGAQPLPPPGALPPPGMMPPPGAVPPPPGEGEDAKDKDKDKDKDEVKDGVRLRGGFNFGGGIMVLPNDQASPIGPAIALNARLGVQINHYFGIVYQNTPIVTFTAQQAGSGITSSASFQAGFADYNSFLVMLTLGNFFDIGAGPSIDFLAVANRSLSLMSGSSNSSSSGVNAGAHGRVAFNIGGLSGNGPRRSGFSIGFDVHPLFTGAWRGISLTGGIGAEWY